MSEGYMELPCAKCYKFKAIALDCYDTKRGVTITKYYCEHCKHKGKKSSHIRINAKKIPCLNSKEVENANK